MCGAGGCLGMLIAIAWPEEFAHNDLVTASAFGAFIAIASAHASAVFHQLVLRTTFVDQSEYLRP